MYPQPNQPMPQPAPQINPQQAMMLQQALAARQAPQMAPQGQIPQQAVNAPQQPPMQPQQAPNPMALKLSAAMQNAKASKDGNGNVSVVTGVPGDLAKATTSATGNKQTVKEIQAAPGGAVVTKTTKQVKAK